MKYGRRMADETQYKERLLVLEDFLFFLCLLVLLYSKAYYDFEPASTSVLF